jgi:enediyne biosynthesis protein E4
MTMAAIDSNKPSSVIRSRHRWRLALAFLCAAGLIWGGYDWWARRSYQSAITEIDKQMAAGRFGMAARNLDRLLAWKPGSDEAAYLLGICEQARGRIQEATAAWSRVTPGSAFAHRAILARMRLFYDSGRCADAEQLINDAAEDPRHDRSDLRVLLVPVYNQLGCIDEAERLLTDRWDTLNETGEGASEPAINLVLLHIELSFKPTPVESIRAYLDHAARAAPEDDRIWLGRANLALRTGLYDEAKRWLDACQRRRPDDIPVWRARLNWAIATNRLEVVQQALKHLPAAESSQAQLYRLNAWLYAQQGDVKFECHELVRALATNPADLAALDRLAQRAEKDGQTAQTAEIVRMKAKIERLRARYEKLFDRKQPVRDAEEIAALAQQLGRGFEARAFLTVAVSEEPDREDLRRDLSLLRQSFAAAGMRGQTLAEVAVHERGRQQKNDVAHPH